MLTKKLSGRPGEFFLNGLRPDITGSEPYLSRRASSRVRHIFAMGVHTELYTPGIYLNHLQKMKRKILGICTFLLVLGCGQNNTYYRLNSLDIQEETPHQVNIIFQVTDYDHKGVPGLTTENFVVYEDGAAIGLESQMEVAPFGTIPTEVRTVLMLDISGSVSSVFQQLKNAAIAFVNSMSNEQKVALLVFDSQVQQVVDFTNSKTTLINAINGLTVGSNSTNLHGAVLEGSFLLFDYYNISHIWVSNMILFTDGDETTGQVDYATAYAASQGKTVYTIGLDGPDLNEQALKSFAGNGARYYKASNIGALEGVFAQIQEDIEKLSQSVYYLYYQSPKRGPNDHSLRLEIVDNSNEDQDHFILEYFNSGIFVD